MLANPAGYVVAWRTEAEIHKGQCMGWSTEANFRGRWWFFSLALLRQKNTTKIILLALCLVCPPEANNLEE